MGFHTRIKWSLCLFLAVSLIIISCGDIFDSDEYNINKLKLAPSITLPLASGDLVIQDFLTKADKANIQVYPAGSPNEGVVYLAYNQTLKTQGIQDLLVFPNKNFNITLPMTTTGAIGPKAAETQTVIDSRTVDFGFSPEKLSEIKFKTTTLKVTVTFTPSSPASTIYDIQVKLPSMKLNDVVFQKRISPGVTGTTFGLQEYIATLTNNTFPLEISLIEKPHSAVTITNPTTLNVSIDFNGIDFKYVKGFFGDQSVVNVPEDVIEFTAFGDAWSKAKVSFASPKLSFSVSNDYGIPTKVTFNPIQAQKNNGSTLAVTLNPTNPIAVNSPAQLGQSAITDVAITNAKQLLDFVPDNFKYKVSARINEGLNSGNNFCADTSKIDVNFKAEIPLYGKASGIVLADTFDIDLSDSENSRIESGAIKVKIENQLPLDAIFQLYLADENKIIFDSLFAPAQTAFVKASTVTATGELLTAGLFDDEIPISKEKLDKIFNARNIILKAKMNTSKNATVDVKFKASYKMNINFGLKAKLKLEVDL
jgi:hypothetical protein